MKYLKTIVFVLVLLVAGYFLLPYVKMKKSDNNNNQNQNTDNSNQQSNSGTIKTFSSDTYGAKFDYNTDQDGDGKADTDAKEAADKVYVYYTATPMEQGQWVQKFPKDPKASLVDAVKKQFLTNISEKDCFAKDLVEFYNQYGAPVPPAPDNVTRAVIAYPFPTDETQPFDQNAGKCPTPYSLSNGLSYFWMDKNHPDNFYFFSIGQYAIIADKDGKTAWQDTFQVTK
jgi:hypothetical protein